MPFFVVVVYGFWSKYPYYVNIKLFLNVGVRVCLPSEGFKFKGRETQPWALTLTHSRYPKAKTLDHFTCRRCCAKASFVPQPRLFKAFFHHLPRTAIPECGQSTSHNHTTAFAAKVRETPSSYLDSSGLPWTAAHSPFQSQARLPSLELSHPAHSPFTIIRLHHHQNLTKLAYK
ncbi:hypothetical protein VTI28DRAFT_5458 [Corynascus sepedonium]